MIGNLEPEEHVMDDSVIYPEETVKYNKDAFTVIKNLDRNPNVPSQPNPELKQDHAKSKSTL